MTTEKAIQLLHRLSDEQFDGIHGDERREALSMAVRALSGDGDMISRKMAIDAIEEMQMPIMRSGSPIDQSVFTGMGRALQAIKALPSAQPTQTNADSTQSNTLERLKGFPIDADLLMIKVLKEYGIMAHDRLYHIIETMDKYELPSAQPRRKTGKWISEVKGKKAIIDEYGNVTCSAHCSECGDWLTGSDEYACRGRYCPSCGARMDGESE